MKKRLFGLGCVCLILMMTISSAYATNSDIIVLNPEIDKVNEEVLQDIFADFSVTQPNNMESNISPMWSSGSKDEVNQGTHGFIAKQGVTLAASSYSGINGFFTSTRVKTLMLASIQPDIDGAATMFKDHFYLPNGDGLAGYPLSAYDNFRNHYNGAIANYNAGNYTEAINRLGMAIHFISDINQPHHASGAAAVVTNHTQYESWVETNENYKNYKVTSMSLSAISAYNGKTLLTIADDSASVARNNYSNANSLNEDKMHNATNVTLKRAQRDVAGVIYKFCKDTGIVS